MTRPGSSNGHGPDGDDRRVLDLDVARRVPKTSELVARDIANAIIGDGLAEGTVLPPEREMTAALGIGRTTLREALRLLEISGALTIRSGPGGGPVVRRPAPADLSEALTLILQFEAATAGDLIGARQSLEVAGAVAAAAAPDSEIEAIAEANDRVLAAIDDEHAFVEANRAFHGAIAHASGNAVLEIFITSVIATADGCALGVRYPAAARRHVYEAHEAIVAALRAHDPVATEAAMCRHLRDSHDYWERHYPDVFSRRVRWID